MAEVVRPLDPRDIVAPLLPSLPVAAIASQPASAVLPLLSPILRQRVQFLSASSSEPWIRLLSYDPAKAAKLVEVARSARLEPHPVSGEIEIDWDSCGDTAADVQVRYKRLDVETLQALVLLRDIDLVFRLVYCEGDAEGGGTGWRVGEVSIPDEPHAFATFGGYATADEAERVFADTHAAGHTSTATAPATASFVVGTQHDGQDDDDDDYWARYDATPARTPAVKRSPAPASMPQSQTASVFASAPADHHNTEAEDAYYAQYDTVQPAMDNHDPDEAVDMEAAGLSSEMPPSPPQPLAAPAVPDTPDVDHGCHARLVHPRPASASSRSSSNGGSAVLVSKLEASAGRQEQSEFGIKQHVSRSIKSLFMLSRAAGIDRDEFEQLVKTELDMLALMED